MARQARKEQLRSSKAVRAEATWRGFDAQRKTGGGGRPALMESQQVEGRRSCRTRRSGRTWTGVSAGANGSVLPATGSARSRRHVRVQGNRPRASRLRASGVKAERERRSCRRLRRCANRVSAAHAREQWRPSS
jgi:hypothetical protein